MPEDVKQEAAEEWRRVSEEETDEIKIVFDTIGDEFIGTYIGHRVIENENGKFTQYRFSVGTETYFTNAGHSLMQGMSHVIKGNRVRVTYVSDKDTGQETPMRVFAVDVSRRQPSPR